MKIKEQAKKIWEDHKCIICYVAGVAAVTATNMIISNGKTSSRDLHFTPKKIPEFPVEMSIKEIKEVLSKVEGAKIYDALIVVRNGVEDLFVRKAS